MDLVDPTKKMSKTEENPKGVIGLLDDVEMVRKKIMGATTDSETVIKFDMENKPGISNLINIYASLTGISISDVEEKFKAFNYGEFKREVASVVCEFLTKIQKRYNEIINSGDVDVILENGAKHVNELARNKFIKMKQYIGMYR